MAPTKEEAQNYLDSQKIPALLQDASKKKREILLLRKEVPQEPGARGRVSVCEFTQ